jgi:chorismate synthase
VYNPANMVRFFTAGESHGQALVTIVEGIPAGVPLDGDVINRDLRRRQGGYGRGRRMAIESDRVEILAGVRRGETIGAPLALLIKNKDWENWQRTMAVTREVPETVTGANRPVVTRPRPGHADLAGVLKYERQDIRDVLERASARETAARVAAGAVARQVLAQVDIQVVSHVLAIGGVWIDDPASVTFETIANQSPDSQLRCVDPDVEQRMIAAIDQAREAGDTLGGCFEVVARGVPPGLGSHVQWDRKLDGRLAQAFMSIPAIKGVGIGLGPVLADRPGSQAHDEIVLAEQEVPGRREVIGLARPTNRAGGLEGGITNGEDVRVLGYMKPISTLMKPLRSVDLATMSPSLATVERSDVCAVPAAAVVGEAMLCLVLLDALLEKYGADSLAALTRHLAASSAAERQRFAPTPVSDH